MPPLWGCLLASEGNQFPTVQYPVQRSNYCVCVLASSLYPLGCLDGASVQLTGRVGCMCGDNTGWAESDVCTVLTHLVLLLSLYWMQKMFWWMCIRRTFQSTSRQEWRRRSEQWPHSAPHLVSLALTAPSTHCPVLLVPMFHLRSSLLAEDRI